MVMAGVADSQCSKTINLGGKAQQMEEPAEVTTQTAKTHKVRKISW